MTISTTTLRNSYSGNGSTTAFAYTYPINTTSEITVIERSATGTETVKTEGTGSTNYGIADNGAAGGTITMVTAPAAGTTLIILRNTELTQETDYVANDPFPAETHEDALDKLQMQNQELQEELDRSIKLSRTNTINSTEFTVDATSRANKILAFDENGEISVTQELGTFVGNWSSATSYNARDLVKDTSTNNVFICRTSHTSSGSQPLTTNTDSAKWSLLVDAASATTSATNAANSATAAATSETNAANSASAASTSETNAATSATNAANSFDSFDDRFLGTKASDPTLDNDGNALVEGAMYYNSTDNDIRFYNGSTWDAPATDAETSATNSANSATASATSATNSANSATASATSATNAATSETNAETAKTNAETAETNAASSATNAASSASTASTKASEASTSASNASTSASNAASSATAASNAQTSVENIFDNFDDRFLGTKTSDPTVDNDGNALSVGAVYYNSVANEVRFYNGSSWEAPSTSAATSATNAASSASTASTQATNASNSASAASTSESNASSSASSALSSKNAAETALDTFDDRFLGAKSSDPSVDNDGDALIDGALYFDNTNNLLKVYDLGNTQWNRTIPTSSDQTKINIVSGISSDVTSVANISTDVTTTANNVAGINSFAERYRVASSDPTTSLDAGDLAFNTSGNVLKYYDGSSWQGITAGGITDVVQDSTPQLGGNLDTQSFTVDGRDVSTDGTKLDGIESGATADQSDAEIKTAYENNSNTNAFTDALQTKLNSASTLTGTETLTNKTLTSPKINEDVVVTSTATELNLLDGKDATFLAVPGKLEGTNFTGSLLVGHTTTGTLNSAQANTGVGIHALKRITTGDNNTMIGYNSGQSILSGRHNTGLGNESGNSITTGLYNINIGYQSGQNITSGDGNVMIGAAVNADSATGDHQLKIVGHNDSATVTWISGDSSGNLVTPGTITANGVVLSGGGQDWQTIVTASTLTAVSGKAYWIDTTSNTCTITLPSSASNGDQIIFADYARNWGTNKIIIDSNGLNYQGEDDNNIVEYNTNGQTVNIVYSGATKGWIPLDDDDVANAPVAPATQRGIFAFGSFSGSPYSTNVSNLVSSSGVVASDTTGVGTNRTNVEAASYGGDKAIFGFGAYTNITNLVSNSGVVATDTTGVGTARAGLAAASYGGDKAIFGYGFDPSFEYSITNLVSNTGVVSSDVTGVGSVRKYLAAAGYGGDKALFGFGVLSSTYYSLTNLVSNTGVVATDTAGVGTARRTLEAASYGGDKAIFGYGRTAGGKVSMTNLVSNTGVVSSDVTGVGSAREALAATNYGGDKAIFAYGNASGVTNITNLVSNTGVVSADTAGAGTARSSLGAAGYSFSA